jgi:hypothetical protein
VIKDPHAHSRINVLPFFSFCLRRSNSYQYRENTNFPHDQHGRDLANFSTMEKLKPAKTVSNPKGAGRPKGSKSRRKNEVGIRGDGRDRFGVCVADRAPSGVKGHESAKVNRKFRFRNLKGKTPFRIATPKVGATFGILKRPGRFKIEHVKRTNRFRNRSVK